MKRIALALLMLSLCCIGCGRSHDAQEARDKPTFDSDVHQARREVITDREPAERIQVDLNVAAEQAKADVHEMKADAQRAADEAVHEVTSEAKEDVKEIKSDAKRTATK